jgi:hypothetical protein
MKDMRFYNRISSQKEMTMHWRAFASLLLLLYVAAYLFSPGSVPHVHHEQDLHHEDSCTKDACHIAIYHPGSKEACNHKFHFTKAPDSCPWCKLISNRQWNLPDFFLEEWLVCYDHYTPNYQVDDGFFPPVIQADRGPPAITL